jgi:hypothetical protein
VKYVQYAIVGLKHVQRSIILYLQNLGIIKKWKISILAFRVFRMFLVKIAAFYWRQLSCSASERFHGQLLSAFMFSF